MPYNRAYFPEYNTTYSTQNFNERLAFAMALAIDV